MATEKEPSLCEGFCAPDRCVQANSLLHQSKYGEMGNKPLPLHVLTRYVSTLKLNGLYDECRRKDLLDKVIADVCPIEPSAPEVKKPDSL